MNLPFGSSLELLFEIMHVYIHLPLTVAMWCKLRLRLDHRFFLLLLMLSSQLPLISTWTLFTLDTIMNDVSNTSLRCVLLHRNVYNAYQDPSFSWLWLLSSFLFSCWFLLVTCVVFFSQSPTQCREPCFFPHLCFSQHEAAIVFIYSQKFLQPTSSPPVVL